MSQLNVSSVGISPTFPITAEEFLIRHVQAVTRVNIDGVEPPTLGAQAGYSTAMRYVNRWFPWIDEKIVEPKFDGVSQYMSVPSNRPTYVKDFHTIALMRAVDHLVQPRYEGLILTEVDTVIPLPPPTPGPNHPDSEG